MITIVLITTLLNAASLSEVDPSVQDKCAFCKNTGDDWDNASCASFLFILVFCKADAICSCSSIARVRPRIRGRMGDRREKRIWRQVCRLPPTDQFPSHQASNLHSVQTNTSPLTRPFNSTHPGDQTQGVWKTAPAHTNAFHSHYKLKSPSKNMLSATF